MKNNEDVKKRIEELVYPAIENTISSLKEDEINFFIHHIVNGIQESLHVWKNLK